MFARRCADRGGVVFGRGTRRGSVLFVVLAVVGAATVCTLIAPAVATIAPATAARSPVSIDALPTVQINGVVWSQAVAGNVVYAGGQFSAARPAGAAPGQNQTGRNNLVAYDITTGVMTSFNANLNSTVRTVAVAPNGTVYVGGHFTSAQGQSRQRIAAFTPGGALIGTFAPSVNGTVRALVATDTAVYLGGDFSTVNGVARNRLAAVSPTGALLGWAPSADDQVWAMTMAPDGSRLIAGGRFTTINGSPAYGLGSIGRDGALLPFAANQVVRDAGPNGAITSLSADGTSVYGTGYDFGTGANFEGAFRADPITGKIQWIEDCHGDSYGVFSRGGAVYTVSHAHDCSTIGAFPQKVYWHRALAFTFDATQKVRTNQVANYYNFGGQPAPTLLSWYPLLDAGTFTGQGQAAWNVVGDDRYLSLGGEFPKVNGKGQQGLVRFAVRSVAGNPNAHGPELGAADMRPTLTSPTPGTVRVSFPTNWDRDDQTLTYRIVRDGDVARPVYTADVDSTFWDLPTVTYTDTGVPGGTHTYRIYANDPAQNTTASEPVSVSVVAGGNISPTASFASSSTGLTVAVDAGSSNDPDGSITGYAWSFGDGGTGSGVTAQHTYASSGTYQLTLTVTDNQGATATRTASVSVTDGTNAAPTAEFSFSATALNVAFDGTLSTDPDGSIAGYAWEFGDGGTGSGSRPSHAYAAAGTYPVTLTVTDGAGATGTRTRQVTVSAEVARDSFTRTVSDGFGTADLGGAWTPTGSSLSVSDGTGRITLAAGVGRGPALTAVDVGPLDAEVTVSAGKRPTGGNLYVYLDGRQTAAAAYRAKVTLGTGGSVGLSVVRVTNGSEATLQSATTSVTYTAGTLLRVRLSLVGTSPTTVRAKIWPAGGIEPSAWTASAVDAGAAQQGTGGISVSGYLSSGATNGPVVLTVDDLVARTG